MSRLLFFTTLFAAAAVLTPTTVFVDGFTTNYGDHRHDGKGRDDGGGVTVVGFRQIVCRAACPSDPKGVNCTTTSFAIGECMATPEPDVFALLLNCVPPPPGPHPPPIMKGSKGWEGEEEKKKGDGAASDHNNRIQRIGKARAVVRVAEEANGGGGQHDHRHSDQNDQSSSSSSSSPSFSSSSSPSSSSRQAPLPPHIALRYIINNSTMPFNKSTTCYYGVNASGVVKQAVGQCFAIAPAPSSALTTTTGGGAEKSESQLPSSNDGLVFYPSFAVAEGNGRRTRDESSRADEGKQRQQDEEAAAAEAFVRSDLMMRRRRRRALKRLKKEEDNKGDDDSTYLYAINFCDLN